MIRLIYAMTIAAIILSVAAMNSLTPANENKYPADNKKLITDARLILSFAELAHRIARNSERDVNLTISKAGDKGHAAIIRDGTVLYELDTDDCLLAPLNYTITFDRNGFPIEPTSITITNGQELYIDISTDGIELSSADISD
jgi:hypothetical protein